MFGGRILKGGEGDEGEVHLKIMYKSCYKVTGRIDTCPVFTEKMSHIFIYNRKNKDGNTCIYWLLGK